MVVRRSLSLRVLPDRRGDCEPCADCERYVAGDTDDLPCGHDQSTATNHCRPCGYVTCRYHLADVRTYRSLRWFAEEIDPKIDERIEIRTFGGRDTCALDVAARGSHRQRDVARLIGTSRERVRQIEDAALSKMRDAAGRVDPDRRREADQAGRGIRGTAQPPTKPRWLVRRRFT